MRANLAAFTVALILASMLVGCGGGSSSSSGGNNGGSNNPTLTSIAVSGPTSVVAGTTGQFTATGTYSDGTSRTLGSSVSWSSSAPTLATVDAMGKVTAVAA